MVVADTAGQEPVAYLVPLGYRGAALEGVPGEALIGTSEHGVLGTRWIYDGAHDPVVLAQLRALLGGEAKPQQQSVSDTPDPTVVVHGTGPGQGSDVRINRVLRPHGARAGVLGTSRRRMDLAGRNGRTGRDGSRHSSVEQSPCEQPPAERRGLSTEGVTAGCAPSRCAGPGWCPRRSG